MTEVTVATLNLKKGELRWPHRAELMLRQMAGLRPDVIGLQEVDLRLDQGNWLCQRLNDLVDGSAEPPYTVHHVANPRENAPIEALAIMTRLPVVYHQGYDYLVRNRVAHAADLEVEGQRFRFWNTHLHHTYDAEGHDLRRRQAEQLLGWLDRDGGALVNVLVGDFNALPDSEAVRLLKGRLTSGYEAAHGREPTRTFWTPLAGHLRSGDPPEGLVIDYVFVSAGCRVLEARVAFDEAHPEDPTLFASDHYGLAARVELP